MKEFLKAFPYAKYILSCILLVIIIIAAVMTIISMGSAFEYDTDEGINLMKASLLMEGLPLYSRVWSDQPPLFTVLLSGWFKLFNRSVLWARLFMLFSSIMLLWVLYQIIKVQQSRFCAFIALAFLILSSAYLRLSVSVMIGIPAFAFAMFSIYLIEINKLQKYIYLLLLSALSMALSLQTKIFTIILLPAILLRVFQSSRYIRNDKIKQPGCFYVSLWLLTCLVAYVCISALYFYPDFESPLHQLSSGFLSRPFFTEPYFGFLVIFKMLFHDIDIVFLALIGVILVIKQKKQNFLLPFFWLLLSFFALFIHRPIWDHHYLLISIPCCWLAAIGLEGLFTKGYQCARNRLGFLKFFTVAAMGLVILMLPGKLFRIKNELYLHADEKGKEIVELIREVKVREVWMFTDRPMFAFRANMLVPPELAVISEKRVLAGNLTTDFFINILEKYQPNPVLLIRFSYYSPKIMSYIQEKYAKINTDLVSPGSLYLLKTSAGYGKVSEEVKN